MFSLFGRNLKPSFTVTLTALKIIAYLCNYLHVPDHWLRPLKDIQEHVHGGVLFVVFFVVVVMLGFFVYLVFFFSSRCGLGFLHEKPPSCRSQLIINLCMKLRSCKCKPKAAHACPLWVWTHLCLCPRYNVMVIKQVKLYLG